MLRNVLSLFDGISCGRLALDRAGIKYEKYYASEIDKYAIAITRYNYSDTIFVGDVRYLKGKNFKDIDLIMGGSPCTGFSFSGKREGMITKEKIEIVSLEQYLELKEQGFEFEGQSYLFWEFVRLLKEIKPKWFLLENVRMAKKWKDVITNALEVEPIEINSALVSAQNRIRLYWTNIPVKGLPEDKGILLRDILEEKVNEKYYINKPFKIIDKNRQSLCDQITQLEIKGHELVKRVYSIDDKSPSVTTTQDGYRQPKILTVPVAELDIKGWKQKRTIYSIKGKSPTVTSQRGGLVEPKILVDRDKSYCIDACCYKGGNLKQYFEKCRKQPVFPIDDYGNIRVRKLTPLECERLQTIPDNYTKFGLFENNVIKQVSDTQRYKVIGNAFTVDVIAWILSFIKEYKE